jgi:hypothetical protein
MIGTCGRKSTQGYVMIVWESEHHLGTYRSYGVDPAWVCSVFWVSDR